MYDMDGDESKQQYDYNDAARDTASDIADHIIDKNLDDLRNGNSDNSSDKQNNDKNNNDAEKQQEQTSDQQSGANKDPESKDASKSTGGKSGDAAMETDTGASAGSAAQTAGEVGEKAGEAGEAAVEAGEAAAEAGTTAAAGGAEAAGEAAAGLGTGGIGFVIIEGVKAAKRGFDATQQTIASLQEHTSQEDQYPFLKHVLIFAFIVFFLGVICGVTKETQDGHSQSYHSTEMTNRECDEPITDKDTYRYTDREPEKIETFFSNKDTMLHTMQDAKDQIYEGLNKAFYQACMDIMMSLAPEDENTRLLSSIWDALVKNFKETRPTVHDEYIIYDQITTLDYFYQQAYPYCMRKREGGHYYIGDFLKTMGLKNTGDEIENPTCNGFHPEKYNTIPDDELNNDFNYVEFIAAVSQKGENSTLYGKYDNYVDLLKDEDNRVFLYELHLSDPWYRYLRWVSKDENGHVTETEEKHTQDLDYIEGDDHYLGPTYMYYQVYIAQYGLRELYKIAGNAGSGSFDSDTSNNTEDGYQQSDDAQATTLSGSDNKTKIWNYFTNKGLTSAGISGLMGNLSEESSYNTNATNSGSGAYGLAQWLGGRKTNLKNYAASKGTSENDLGTQLDFIWSELTSSYRGVLQVLQTTNSVKEASDTVLYDYEKPTTRSKDAANGYAVSSKRGGVSDGVYTDFTGYEATSSDNTSNETEEDTKTTKKKKKQEGAWELTEDDEQPGVDGGDHQSLNNKYMTNFEMLDWIELTDRTFVRKKAGGGFDKDKDEWLGPAADEKRSQYKTIHGNPRCQFLEKGVTPDEKGQTTGRSYNYFYKLSEITYPEYMERRYANAPDWTNEELQDNYTFDEDLQSYLDQFDDGTKKKELLTLAFSKIGSDRYSQDASKKATGYYYDCSSYVSYLYQTVYGINIGSTTKSQIVNSNLERISYSELEPGDLIYRDHQVTTGKNEMHVAMYIGGGKIIHAQSSKTGIVISDVYNANDVEINSGRGGVFRVQKG